MEGRLTASFLGGDACADLDYVAIGRDRAVLAVARRLSSAPLFVLGASEHESDDGDDSDSDEKDEVCFLQYFRQIDTEAVDLTQNKPLASCFDSCGNYWLLLRNDIDGLFLRACWSRDGGVPIIETGITDDELFTSPVLISRGIATYCFAVHDDNKWAVAISGTLVKSSLCEFGGSALLLDRVDAVAFSSSGELFVVGSRVTSPAHQVVCNMHGPVFSFDGGQCTKLAVSSDAQIVCCLDVDGVVHTSEMAFTPIGPFGQSLTSVDAMTMDDSNRLCMWERGLGVHVFI